MKQLFILVGFVLFFGLSYAQSSSCSGSDCCTNKPWGASNVGAPSYSYGSDAQLGNVAYSTQTFKFSSSQATAFNSIIGLTKPNLQYELSRFPTSSNSNNDKWDFFGSAGSFSFPGVYWTNISNPTNYWSEEKGYPSPFGPDEEMQITSLSKNVTANYNYYVTGRYKRKGSSQPILAQSEVEYCNLLNTTLSPSSTTNFCTNFGWCKLNSNTINS